ncbi:MAG: fatty acid metabolism transcriptional regulator FadR [Rubrobacteraceae bacterium]
MEFLPPLRPTEYAERSLVSLIVGGTYPAGSFLPGERQLAETLGVTRPTVREALQRLSRDGWLQIRQGSKTRVRDYMREGGLRILATLARTEAALNPGLVGRLLELRCSLAPDYVRGAVAAEPAGVLELLGGTAELGEDPDSFAEFDWRLHRDLARLCENPLYAMTVNDFSEVYALVAPVYFAYPRARRLSRSFYDELRAVTEAGDDGRAKKASEEAMRRAVVIWKERQAPGAAERRPEKGTGTERFKVPGEAR